VNQSSFIAAVLLAGFVLFLAAKGRLTAYTAVLWGATSAPLASGVTTQTQPGDKIIPIPGTPGLNLSNPFAGLPSWVGSILGGSL
jgi:hypothetical protein